MKAPTTLSLSGDTATKLTELAATLSVQRSALADLLLRYSLSRVTAERLTEWSKTARSSTKPAEVKVRGSEATAFNHLTGEWQTFTELRALTGQGVGVLHRALNTLEKMGRAELDPLIGARDAKGRAVNSKWRLKAVST